MPFLVDHRFHDQPLLSRVEGDRLRIGRGTNAELRLEEASVDLEHARIEGDPAGYRLIDNGSVTGSYLNGKPAAGAYLRDGDTIDIGSTRIQVGWSGAPEPLRLTVRPPAAERLGAPEAAPLPGVEEIDYLGAYRLRRPLLTQGSLALFLTALALAAVAILPLTGLQRAFQPGEISDAHQRELKSRRAEFPVSCAGCHRPWRGPVEGACVQCHTPKTHQAAQPFEPPCAGCHFEHRGKDSLTRVPDANCVSCHGDLRVKAGAAAVFARRATSFPAGHPDFSVDLRPGVRLLLADAAAQRADPDRLKFGHRRHLERPLRRPDGTRVQLACADCHRVSPAAGPTAMEPVRYEAACAACHPLTFDRRLPGEQAPHADPRRVREFLVSVYSDRRDPSLSIREIRNRIVRGTGGVGEIDFGTRATRAVFEAERYVYGIACHECHEVDVDAVPVPRVVRPEIRPWWLPHSRFPHSAHTQGIACVDCHGAASGSRETGDLLLPGIAACGGCHGGNGAPPGTAKLRAARTECRDCHRYHPQVQG